LGRDNCGRLALVKLQHTQTRQLPKPSNNLLKIQKLLAFKDCAVRLAETAIKEAESQVVEHQAYLLNLGCIGLEIKPEEHFELLDLFSLEPAKKLLPRLGLGHLLD